MTGKLPPPQRSGAPQSSLSTPDHMFCPSEHFFVQSGDQPGLSTAAFLKSSNSLRPTKTLFISSFFSNDWRPAGWSVKSMKQQYNLDYLETVSEETVWPVSSLDQHILTVAVFPNWYQFQTFSSRLCLDWNVTDSSCSYFIPPQSIISLFSIPAPQKTTYFQNLKYFVPLLWSHQASALDAFKRWCSTTYLRK